jgi:hypothetical protein
MNRSDYLALLLKPNQAGFTPLHQAANSNSLAVLTIFLEELKKTLTPQEYNKALSCRAKGHIPSCERKKSNATAINQLLDKERQNALHFSSEQAINFPSESKYHSTTFFHTSAKGKNAVSLTERREFSPLATTKQQTKHQL